MQEDVSLENTESILIEMASVRGLQFKYWWTGPIQRGDCLIEKTSSFYLYSDGSTYWNAEISSGDTNDEWRGTIAIKDINSHNLFIMPEHRYKIKGKNEKQWWEIHTPPSPIYAPHFDAAHFFSYPCRC